VPLQACLIKKKNNFAIWCTLFNQRHLSILRNWEFGIGNLALVIGLLCFTSSLNKKQLPEKDFRLVIPLSQKNAMGL
jgi:hypothetical protein